MALLAEIFSHPFLIRAAIAGTLIALCASVLGVSLVLKRYAMLGDGLSHVGFGAMAVGIALGLAPLAVAMPVVLATAFLLLRLRESNKVRGDSAIALVSTGSLAIGVLALGQTAGVGGIHQFMFGSILAVTTADVYWGVALSAVVLPFFVLFFKQIFALTYDESFARTTGAKVGAYNTLLALLTAMTVVLGMRLMGALLISSLLVFPALSAIGLCRTFRSVVTAAAIISVVCFFAGLIASFQLNLPVGPSVTVLNLIVFVTLRGIKFARQFGAVSVL